MSNPATAKPPKPDHKPKKPKALHGIMIATDGVSSMTVRVKGKPQVLSVSAECTVTLNKLAATFKDLLVGDNCFVVEDPDSGQVIAIDARREEE
jgi:hypothetical protein